ncbi:hypothetical protein SUGI_0460910 [Cryptomeria japonica]|nr:hypothetical protein SUGI_0460910 [Cryptomeria japonica]
MSESNMERECTENSDVMERIAQKITENSDVMEQNQLEPLRECLKKACEKKFKFQTNWSKPWYSNLVNHGKKEEVGIKKWQLIEGKILLSASHDTDNGFTSGTISQRRPC